MKMQIQHFNHDGLKFRVLKFGTDRKGTIIMLHGFPASADSWIPTAQILAEAGYMVLALDQRGYSEKARPGARSAYRLSKLVDDVVALINSKGLKKVHLVGHDWGGVVAWAFAGKHPDMLLSLVTVSTPHPIALLKSLFMSSQIVLSWYMIFFQLPHLPERILAANGGRNLYNALRKSGLSSDTARSYVKRMQDKSLLTSAINWYRALPYTLFQTKAIGHIITSTLFIYGDKDRFLSHSSALLTANWCSDEYELVRLTDAGHWIPEEFPKKLADYILAHVGQTLSR